MGKADTQLPLLPHGGQSKTSSSRKSLTVLLSLFALVAFLAPGPWNVLSRIIWPVGSPRYTQHSDVMIKSACAQAEPILPPMDLHNISSIRDYKDRIIKWHQGIIQVPTFVFDEMGEPGEDPKWDIFHKLHSYLEKSYPLVHKNLKLTKVDTIGLVYEWIGTDTSLQPLMLTGHQDVVPVLPETEYLWEHPPFAGEYDGEYIWGRGSADDKSGVTTILSAIELLLETSDFKPRRTVILGFGHDEERGGQRGAPAIRDWLLETYGKDSMAMIVDEGSGLSESWGRMFATPAVAEKGKLNVNMTLSTLGGHSSIPPKHTNIGLTSVLIHALEENQNPIIFEKSSPLWGYLQCAARFAPEMPKSLEKSVTKAQKCSKAFSKLPEDIISAGIGAKETGAGQGNLAEALMTTTQAIDMIHGGFKVNALPEVTEVIINHRVNIHSLIDDVREHIYQTLLSAAEQYDLAVSGWGRDFKPESGVRGTVFLSDVYEVPHEAAPITPTTLDVPAWRMLAGTSRGMWASRKEVSEDGALVDLAEDDELIMAPFMSTGNTDTRRYWDLTRNIYRYAYQPSSGSKGAHTINEHVSADALVEQARFFQSLILNVDSSEEM